MFYHSGRGFSDRGRAYVGPVHNRANESTSKAKKSSYLEMRFLIPKQSADLIIGSNGSNIQRLHKEYCAMLNISGSTTPERILTVGGFDIPTMVSMLQDVITGLKMALLDQGFGGEADMIGMLLDESEVDYITSVDDYQLNQILEDSGTHIDVFLMCCPQSSDRVIRIKGEPECIVRCIASLYQLLEWCPTPANRQPYDADNANEEYAADYGGFTEVDDLTEQAMDISYGEEEGDSTNQTNISAGFSAVDEKPNAGPLLSQTGPSLSQTGPLLSQTSPSLSQPITTKLSIQSSVVGAIMGKGGARLNHIRHESTANIKLDSEMQAAERIITISGTVEEVENAKELLRLCIQHLCVRIK